MPTLPSGPVPPRRLDPHRERGMAESFGVDAERYDRTRPPYPQALVDRIVAAAPGTDFLDVGCGTGIVGRQFRAAGCSVLGVEPDERMADFARRDGLDVEVAGFEAWDPAGRSFDAVVAGTAWHWVDPAAGAVQAGRVLRAGGRLALFWHVFEAPAAVDEALTRAFRRALPDFPLPSPPAADGATPGSTLDRYQPILDRAAEGIRGAGGFGEPEQWRYDWERRYTRAEWLDQLPTTGALTRLPAESLDPLLADVGAAIDALGGSFVMSYATVAVAASRTTTA